MTAPLVLHAAPAAGFDQPFELLDACHRRVERTLGLLARLAAHLPAHGADAAARQAATDVLRYFDLAAPLHHEDEERHLLPRLRAAGHAALAERVAADHAQMGAAWRVLRAALAEIEAGRVPAAFDPAPFAALYAEHLRLEDDEVYPAARPLLAGDALAAMADEMAQRRGVRPVRGAR